MIGIVGGPMQHSLTLVMTPPPQSGDISQRTVMLPGGRSFVRMPYCKMRFSTSTTVTANIPQYREAILMSRKMTFTESATKILTLLIHGKVFLVVQVRSPPYVSLPHQGNLNLPPFTWSIRFAKSSFGGTRRCTAPGTPSCFRGGRPTRCGYSPGSWSNFVGSPPHSTRTPWNIVSRYRIVYTALTLN